MREFVIPVTLNQRSVYNVRLNSSKAERLFCRVKIILPNERYRTPKHLEENLVFVANECGDLWNVHTGSSIVGLKQIFDQIIFSQRKSISDFCFLMQKIILSISYIV